MKKIIIEEREGVLAKQVEVHNPSRNRIYEAINQVDGKSCSLLTIISDDGAQIMVGGGPLRFICTANCGTSVINVLSEDSDADDFEEIVVGGQSCDYPRKYVLDKSIILRLVDVLIAGFPLEENPEISIEVIDS